MQRCSTGEEWVLLKTKFVKNQFFVPWTVCDDVTTISFQDCAGVILYAAENATQVALDAIQILGKSVASI